MKKTPTKQSIPFGYYDEKPTDHIIILPRILITEEFVLNQNIDITMKHLYNFFLKPVLEKRVKQIYNEAKKNEKRAI